MRIGIDFDNTIVCYDEVFYLTALEKGLIPFQLSRTKLAVRNYLRAQGQEEEWILLQGLVYGPSMKHAVAFPGCKNFFDQSNAHKISLAIISHKTRNPERGPPHDLHQSARLWLQNNKFLFQPTFFIPTYFELTRAEKIRRIIALKCTIFIDDLPEFLLEAELPPFLRRILFDPHNQYTEWCTTERCTSWDMISCLVAVDL